ncbi:hypothetical protein DYBT9623_04444 [Dyadobacter sp. CECT 9623]|uniref:DUF1351 domain-containing protein n=1 Tax=Dyadobacter linearis TaxID=2823330 RepID=A0ABM8UVR6_9BACT|nr:hypothetical protein [Dyadobacter sp. CECT 9623]CAG5072907.1 hypothetical protein DYBT9623_04444 [Dyadobacter sp. CECT 9623]
MSVEVLELPEADKLAPITKVETEIVRMRKAYSGLTIKDTNDKEGFGKVTAARKEVKALRVQVDKERKTLIDDAVKWQRQVNEVAKGITEQLVAIEEPLQQKENDFIAERERQKQEAERQRLEKLRARCLVIASIPDVLFDGVSYILQDVTIDAEGIEKLSDDAFQTKVEAFEAKYQTILEARLEAERIAKEEADRLEAARKEQEAAAAELKRQQEELAAERKRLDDEKAAHEAALKREQEEKDAETRRAQREADAKAAEEKRLADLEAARQEAAEKARQEAELKAKQEAEAKAEADRIAKEKEVKRLARRPDLMKFVDMTSDVLKVVNSFEFKTEEGKSAQASFLTGIELLIKSSTLSKAE